MTEDTKTTRIRKRISLKRSREELEEQDKHVKPAPKTTSKPKRRKAASRKPVVLTKEATWEGWKDVYFIGTEWDNYHKIFEHDWDFDHLQEKIFDGDLAQGKTAYLFGSTEPQMIDGKVVLIPVIVAIVGDIPPPRKVGITSIQMASEDIVDMADLKMSWVPFVKHISGKKKKGASTTPSIYFLHCATRRPTLRLKKEEDVKKYDFAMPYFMKPSDLLRDDSKTDVQGVVSLNKKQAISFDFNWESDTLNDYVDELLEEHELDPAEYKETIKSAIKEEVIAAKKRIEDDKARKKKEYDEMPEELKKSLNDVKKFKFYPQNKVPNLAELGLVSPFINRYYGTADQVF
jgi:hypothetical protein